MHHYRKTLKRYRANNSQNAAAKSCPFCDDERRMKSVFETEFSYVIPNKIEYDLWESHRVLEHHMVLPKRHAESIGEMNDQERQDMLQIIADYEAKGFNIYARGVGGPTRSIAHQHTHLIRIQPDRPKLIVHIKKPHFLIRF